MEKGDRFQKIENNGIIVGITKKDPDDGRFEHLEIGGKESEKETDASPERKYFPCPKCNRNNRKGNLYCIYCGEIFPDVAEKTESDLQPYEIKCPACGKTGNINQKTCIWCGYHFVHTEEDVLQEGNTVQIEVNGAKYSSTDRYLPKHVRDAMVSIKTQGTSKENMEKIFKDLQVARAGGRIALLQEIEKNKSRVVAYAVLAAGGILTFTGLFLTHRQMVIPAFIFLAAGLITVISGFMRMAMTGPE